MKWWILSVMGLRPCNPASANFSRFHARCPPPRATCAAFSLPHPLPQGARHPQTIGRFARIISALRRYNNDPWRLEGPKGPISHPPDRPLADQFPAKSCAKPCLPVSGIGATLHLGRRAGTGRRQACAGAARLCGLTQCSNHAVLPSEAIPACQGAAFHRLSRRSLRPCSLLGKRHLS